MKPGIDIISVFEKVKDEKGEEYFTGTLDLSVLKKTKLDEIQVVFITGDLLPGSVHSLLGRQSDKERVLFMFAKSGATQKR